MELSICLATTPTYTHIKKISIQSRSEMNFYGFLGGADLSLAFFVAAFIISRKEPLTGSACGFILKLPEGNFYYSGDTGLTRDMELIPKYYAHLNFAVLPIGGNFTMNVDGAIIASNFIECNKIIGVHYDTFEYIKIDKERAIQKFADAGKELILIDIGDTIEL